ncbi:hypothetical protein MCNS_31160 [Mycobacterium conspicuum]|uniref:Uncharacterized protein n=1 Tax=Mycobacterium conspicuum TaxID=44010 RepID=A0A7I7YGD3_9MYCO|nr:hypothetical protein MCNS_31160 [Mycobacterium conspicuum]
MIQVVDVALQRTIDGASQVGGPAADRDAIDDISYTQSGVWAGCVFSGKEAGQRDFAGGIADFVQ